MDRGSGRAKRVSLARTFGVWAGQTLCYALQVLKVGCMRWFRVVVWRVVGSASLLMVGGCSRSLEIDLPAGYHGHVAIFCEQLTRSSRPIHVDGDGEAKNAMCPRAKTSLAVLRDGIAVQPLSLPKWVVTGDGIVLSIEFDVL